MPLPRRVLVIDGETRGQDLVDPSAGISVAAFEEALKEDNQALAAEFGISATPEAHDDEHEEERAEVPHPDVWRHVVQSEPENSRRAPTRARRGGGVREGG